MASRRGFIPTGIFVVTWLVAESITATEFERVVTTKSCGMLAVLLASAGADGGSANQVSARVKRARPSRQAAIAGVTRGARTGHRIPVNILLAPPTISLRRSERQEFRTILIASTSRCAKETSRSRFPCGKTVRRLGWSRLEHERDENQTPPQKRPVDRISFG